MDRFGTGSPYALAAVLVAATLLITAPLEDYMALRKPTAAQPELETGT
jgi:hypothetical protein